MAWGLDVGYFASGGNLGADEFFALLLCQLLGGVGEVEIVASHHEFHHGHGGGYHDALVFVGVGVLIRDEHEARGEGEGEDGEGDDGAEREFGSAHLVGIVVVEADMELSDFKYADNDDGDTFYGKEDGVAVVADDDEGVFGPVGIVEEGHTIEAGLDAIVLVLVAPQDGGEDQYCKEIDGDGEEDRPVAAGDAFGLGEGADEHEVEGGTEARREHEKNVVDIEGVLSASEPHHIGHDGHREEDHGEAHEHLGLVGFFLVEERDDRPKDAHKCRQEIYVGPIAHRSETSRCKDTKKFSTCKIFFL